MCFYLEFAFFMRITWLLIYDKYKHIKAWMTLQYNVQQLKECIAKYEIKQKIYIFSWNIQYL